MKPTIRTLLDAGERASCIPALAALRISVFRDWPYLYDGTAEYEAAYLREFSDAEGSVLVVAEQGRDIVGAATASPMALQKPDFLDAVCARGMDVSRLFYFGESVLLPNYRGMGIGHGFFDAREAAAHAAGANAALFCAVVRPEDHRLRPTEARDLQPFWRSRGYAPVNGLICEFEWKDIDQLAETKHPMQFWMKEL